MLKKSINVESFGNNKVEPIEVKPVEKPVQQPVEKPIPSPEKQVKEKVKPPKEIITPTSQSKEELQSTPRNNKQEVPDLTKFDIDGKFLHVKVGTTEVPANDEQIQEVRSEIEKVIKFNNIRCGVLVTHHAVEVKIIE